MSGATPPISLMEQTGTSSVDKQGHILISNFRRVLNVVLFLYTHTYSPVKMEQTECSETLAFKTQTSGNYPKEIIQQGHICLSLQSL
jgi:hypothetical protein